MTRSSVGLRSRFSSGLSGRRQAWSALAAVVSLILVTLAISWNDPPISESIIFLVYLAAVVALSAAGGPIVGTGAAIGAFLMVNYFFTDPVHTLGVADPERAIELVIFLAIAGTVAALVDTASRQQDQLQVTVAENEQLSAADDLRVALLRAVSHDLRTPLAAVKLATTSLSASDVSLNQQQRSELLDVANTEIDRLGEIIEQLLDAGRLQAGPVSVQMRPTSLAPLVAHAIDVLAHAEASRIRVDLSDAASAVLVDPALLERILVNLLNNALDAADTGPVTVTGREVSDHRIALSVSDHGPGMNEEERSAAIRPFQRYEDRGARSGIGLGLAICAGFAQAMGSELRLSEEHGGGLCAELIVEAAS